MHDPTLVNAVVQLAASLDRLQIEWCVLRNYESFPIPRSDTSDLDLLVACPPSVALDVFYEILECLPVRLTRVFTKSDSTLLGLFLTCESGPTLHIDLMFDIAWRGFSLVSTEFLVASRHVVLTVPRPRPGCEAASSLLSYLFHQNRVKSEYAEQIRQFIQIDRQGFLESTTTVWGSRTATAMADHALDEDWEWFRIWVKGAKWHLHLMSWKRPLKTIKMALKIGVNLSSRVIAPPGLWIAFLGPDGAGKTTVGAAYRARLDTLFYPGLQRQLHWRPRLLPTPSAVGGRSGESINVTQPHLKPPHGQFKSLVRLLYFWVDYVVGHWVRVRPLIAKGGLVIFDRYYQDFLVDPLRYRLNLPAKLIRALGKTVPQPELLFIFDAPAEVMFARKQELPLDEINAQLAVLRQLAKNNPAARIIRVDRSVDAIVDEMVRETLDYLDQRNRRRLGWENRVRSTEIDKVKS